MRSLRTIVVACGMLVVASTAHAEPMMGAGTRDLSLHLSPDFWGAVGDIWHLDLGYGYFVRDRLALRATAHHELIEDVVPVDDDYRASEYSFVCEYHLDLDGAIVPYVGAEVGWARTQIGLDSKSGAIYGPRIGVKYFLTDSAAIDLAIAYKMSSKRMFLNDWEAEDTDLRWGVGLRVMF